MFYVDILKSLHENSIRYLIVGGVAVNLHGVPRATFDFDLLISIDEDNILRFLEVMEKDGFVPGLPEDPKGLLSKEKINDWIKNRNLIAFSFYNKNENHKVIDIVLDHHLDFEEAYSRRVVHKFDSLELHLASIDDLIEMKEKSARPKDLKDIEFLKKAKDLGKTNGS
ncbi:MAG: hypothetical protein KDK36_01700 [Leptospiraceae bacterium]|nr:hypothetical protein [Leptospiraceae bacterium]